MSKLFIAHLLIEFGPLIVFFFVSAGWGFYPGATALVVSTVAALYYSTFHLKRFAWFSFTVSLFTLVSGIATLYFQQPLWIVLEFTISNLAFGLVLLLARRQGKLFLKSMFQHMFLITEAGWRLLTARWGWAFIVIGSTNQLFWYWCPNEDLWTLFRFVVTLLTFVFAISQFSLSRRERLPDASRWGMRQ